MTTPPNQPPGWYPDHHDPRLLRWWDGSSWSYHVQPRPGVPPAAGTTKVAGGVVIGAVIAVVALMALGALGLLVAVFLAAGGSTSTVGKAQPSEATVTAGPEGRTAKVTRVVDGDTLELADGEHVRLRGMDTPEVGECGFQRATQAMVRLVEGKRVVLTRAGDDRDRYDRLLRYVDVDGTDAGLRLIQLGLARARYDSRDGYGAHPREAAYIRADRAAADVTCE